MEHLWFAGKNETKCAPLPALIHNAPGLLKLRKRRSEKGMDPGHGDKLEETE